ncbi:MAG: gliding motility-associated C-terminal domain-containing protein [Bacteroidia bacterium]
MSQGTHLMGGDLTYRHLKDSTYELTFLVYRDCNNGQAAIDPSITYWVYYKKTKNIFINNRTINLYNNTADTVKPEAPNCVTPSGVCIQSGRYIDTVVLGSAPDGYIVNWFRLARNYNITNLKNCVSSTNNNSCNTGSCNNRNPFGMVWTAEVPPHKFENSSPQFLTVPVPYFCTGITNSFNHVVFDPDGDSLVFKLVTPLSPDNCAPIIPRPSSTRTAPAYNTTYDEVIYQSGYSVSRPFGSSSSAISINSTTGEMKANPRSAGNYVIAVKIEEYRVDPVTRKATYLGSVRRDLQFVAGNCPNVTNTPPYFTQSGNSVIEVDPFDTVKFTIKTADNSDTVYMSANGSIFGGAGSTLNPPFAKFNDTSGFKAAEQEFFWVPTCDHITYTSPHVFTINLADEGCNTVQRTYSVYVRGRKIYTPPDITCLNRISKNIIEVKWDTLKNVQFFKGLYVYRVDPDGSRNKIRKFTDSTALGFFDSTVVDAYAANVKYYLRIENSCGLEGFRSDSLTTVGLSYSEINDNSLRFNWNSYGDGPFRYVLEKKTGNSFIPTDSTTNTTLDYSSCILNTDFRIKVVDTTKYKSCIHYSDTVSSTTIDTSPPQGAPTILNASVMDHNKVELTFRKSSSNEVNQYGIIRSTNGASFSQIATTPLNTNTIVFSDVNSVTTSNNNYCYRVIAQDSCGNAGDTSLKHCTVNLKGYDGQRASKLRWNKYRGFSIDSQFVQRFDTINQNWVNIAALGASDSTYLDQKNTLCGFTYFYRIATKEKTTGTPYIALSDSVFTLPKDSIAPSAIDVVSASNYSEDSTYVTFKKSADSDVKDYLVVSLAYNTGVLQNTDISNHALSGADTFTVLVKTPKTDSLNYCFGVLAVDSCGQNFSPNNEIHCLSFLTGQARNRSNRIEWTNYTGFLVDSFIVETKENGVWKTQSSFDRIRRNITYNNLGCNVPVEYRLKVKERNSSRVVYTNDIILTPFDTIKPSSPIVDYTTVENDTTIKFKWNKSSDDDVYKYEILVDTNGNGFGLLDSFVNDNSNTFEFFHRPINAKNDTFSYRIVAVDSCSVLNRSVNNKLQTAIQLSGEGANQENNLRWNAYKGFSVKEYEIETFDDDNSQWSTLQTLSATSTSFIHENLYCFDTIIYRIKALDNNSSEFSYSDTIRLKPFDTISPIPPVINYVSVIAQNEIDISWARSQSDDANKYVLFRRSENTNYVVVDTFLNTLSYTDQVSTDSIWTYALIAIDSCTENSSYYKSASESTMLLTDAQIGCEDKLLLTWSPYNDFENGLSGYEVYRSINGNNEVRIAQLNNTTTNYTDNVSQHLDYTYRIKAIEVGGANESYSQIIEANTYKTAVPRVLTASVQESRTVNGEVEIYWKKQEGTAQIEYSRLYYKNTSSINYTLLQDNLSLSDSTYTHSGINTKTETHQYFLVNVDSCGTSSDTLSIHKTIDMQFGYGQLEHNLSWNQYEGFNVEQYNLQQFLGGSFVNIDTVDANNPTFRRFPAPCNTPIIYRIAAEDIDGYQAYSDTTMGTAIDLTVPDAPEIRNITISENKSIEIDFVGVDSLDTYGFAIEKSKNGSAYLTQGIILFTGQKQVSNYSDTAKLDSNRFAYKVVALDSCLNANASTIFKPIALKGNAGNFENHLAWHPFVGYAVDSYIVEYQIAPYDEDDDWLLAGSSNPGDTQLTHTNIGCNQELVYRIRAEQTGNNTIATISNHLNLTPFDTISPSKPLFYSASAIDDKQLELNWAFDVDSDIKYFTIEKLINGSWNSIDTVIRANSIIDSVLNATDSIYTYRINAIDSCNNQHISPYSDTITNFIFNIGLDTCDATTYIDWNKPEGLLDGISSYYISRSVDGRPFRIIDTVLAPGLTFADTNVVSGSSYSYRIIASNDAIMQSSQTDSISFIQKVRPKPLAPSLVSTSVTATGDIGGTVELTWNKVRIKQDPYVTGYRVYGADTILPNYNLIASLNSRNDTSYTHTTANLTKYNYYRIVAVNTCDANGDSSLLTSPIQLDVENLNLSSNLTWSEYFGFDVSEYKIFSSIDGATFNQIGTVSGNSFAFRDSTVGCGESINFRVEAVSTKGFLASSDIENVIGFDTTLPQTTTMQLVTVKSNDIEISWNPSRSKDAKFYTIEYKRFNDNVWDTLLDQTTALTYSTNALPIPVNNPWQFRIGVTDSCGNSQPVPSKDHHLVAIEASKEGSATQVKWMNYKGWQVDSFEIVRDGNKIAAVSTNGARFDSVFVYMDSAMNCDSTIYDYQVKAISNAVGLISESNNDTTIGIDRSIEATVQLQSASVLLDNSGVRLSWTKNGLSDLKYYQILRKAASQDNYSIVKRVDASNQSTIDTISMNDSKYYCYKIAAEDNCKNEGVLSNEACPMVITGGNLLRANSVKWNAYSIWKDSVDRYEVYRGTDSINLFYLDEFDSRIRAFVDTNLNDTFMTNCYRVRAVEKQGETNNTAWSTTFCITQEPLIYIPTAFTPELSEGTNDFFGPKGAFVPNSYSMKIYNRWGQRIYETNQGIPWNGKFIDNSFVPVGVYLYQIEIITSNGESYTRTGNVKIIR